MLIQLKLFFCLDTGVIDWQQMGTYCGTLCLQQGRRGNLRPELRKLWGMKVNHHCQPRKVTLKSSCPQKPSPSSLDFMTVAKIWKNEGGISFTSFAFFPLIFDIVVQFTVSIWKSIINYYILVHGWATTNCSDFLQVKPLSLWLASSRLYH